jgi:anti-anti-sigma regulatory factor
MQDAFDAATVTATLVRGCLIVSVPAELSTGAFEALRGRTLAGLQQGACRAVVFDLSAVAIMDGEDFGQLRRLVATTRLLGVRALLVGFQAGVVIHLMDSGVDTAGLEVARDLEEALDRTRPAAHEAADESSQEAHRGDDHGDGDAMQADGARVLGEPAPGPLFALQGAPRPASAPVRSLAWSAAPEAPTTPWR